MASIASIRGRLANIEPKWILFAGWLIAIAYAFPGYMNWDSGDQIFQARNHKLQDWHPPVMGAYWRVIEYVWRGPAGMLVLQTSLFVWGIYALLRLRIAPRAAAWVTAALVLFPPVLTPMAVVWKDAQMAGFLVAGLALALRPEHRKIALGVVLLLLAGAVRDNGAAALPPLCLLIVASWQLRRRVATWSLAIGMFIAIVALGMLANRAATRSHMHPWYRTVAIHDIAGTICIEDAMTDDEVRAALPGVPLLVTSSLQHNMCKQYNPRVWFALTFGDNNIFGQDPKKAERRARLIAWWSMVRDHTYAFLTHRWNVMREVIGISDSQPWEPVCQSFAANEDQLRRIHHDAELSPFQKAAGAWFFSKWSTTVLYRPWAYILVSFVLLGYAAVRRDRLVAALLGSGLLYEASYFLGAAAPDYRYSHWMVTCCCLAIALVFRDRLDAGRRAAKPTAAKPAS